MSIRVMLPPSWGIIETCLTGGTDNVLSVIHLRGTSNEFEELRME